MKIYINMRKDRGDKKIKKKERCLTLEGDLYSPIWAEVPHSQRDIIPVSEPDKSCYVIIEEKNGEEEWRRTNNNNERCEALR